MISCPEAEASKATGRGGGGKKKNQKGFAIHTHKKGFIGSPVTEIDRRRGNAHPPGAPLEESFARDGERRKGEKVGGRNALVADIAVTSLVQF